MRGIWRLVLLLGVAVVAFAAALGSFARDAEAGCETEAPEIGAYAVEIEGEARTDQTDHVLIVTRNGEPVEGAAVCLTTAMEGMAAMAVSGQAREVGRGRYQVSIRLEMAGSWSGTVLVTEPGSETVSVPVTFDVVAPS